MDFTISENKSVVLRFWSVTAMWHGKGLDPDGKEDVQDWIDRIIWKHLLLPTKIKALKFIFTSFIVIWMDWEKKVGELLDF